jgi:hypothetical protein
LSRYGGVSETRSAERESPGEIPSAARDLFVSSACFPISRDFCEKWGQSSDVGHPAEDMFTNKPGWRANVYNWPHKLTSARQALDVRSSEECFESFKALKSEVDLYPLETQTEADTRARIISRVLHDVLDWPQ